MSATDELRRLLDERGVEWSTRDTTFRLITYWKTDSGIPVHYAQTTDVPYPPTNVPRTITAGLTPEQAIAATLGGGECEVISHYYYDDYDLHEFELSCGHSYTMSDGEPYPYCPTCGAKVKAVKR